MRDALIAVTEVAVVVIDSMALLIILGATIEAFVRGLKVAFMTRSDQERRDVFLRYARWLVAALSFQLAADIIETSIGSDWESIGKVAAIAVVRTFLNYFLERDLEGLRERLGERAAA
ncbi:MAG TPA: DUF1622 domain-containing protein [Gemmatimonadales bacterium]|nr:DUF1622 domain-containing protein [Gemmatimonadales bacterium]